MYNLYISCRLKDMFYYLKRYYPLLKKNYTLARTLSDLLNLYAQRKWSNGKHKHCGVHFSAFQFFFSSLWNFYMSKNKFTSLLTSIARLSSDVYSNAIGILMCSFVVKKIIIKKNKHKMYVCNCKCNIIRHVTTYSTQKSPIVFFFSSLFLDLSFFLSSVFNQ